MTLQGTIRGGVVVLDQPVPAPDGTKVSVFVSTNDARRERSAEEKVARSKAALAEILAIPDENPNDDFRAEDHDKVLYGDHE
jgi:hypothetical protein